MPDLKFKFVPLETKEVIKDEVTASEIKEGEVSELQEDTKIKGARKGCILNIEYVLKKF